MDQIVLLIIIILTAAITAAVVVLLGKRSALPSSDLAQQLNHSLQQNMQTLLQQMTSQQRSQEHFSGQIHTQVSETTRAVSALQSKLSALEEGNKRLLDMSKSITELQNILQAPKLRGNQGEIWLEELIAEMIPRGNFETQYRFKSGEICDMVIKLRDNVLLPIDSKFSLENFKKMLEANDDTAEKTFAKAFAADTKRRIDEISKKYVLPDEGTLSFAFMYVPAENVYYQAFIEDKEGHQLQRYAFEKRVVPVSPNSLYAYLEIVLLGLRGLEIEKGAKAIQQGLGGLRGELARFAESYDKVGNNLRMAREHYKSGSKRLEKVDDKLSGLSAGATMIEKAAQLPEETETHE